MQKTCDKMFVLITKNTFIVRKILLFVYYNIVFDTTKATLDRLNKILREIK